MQLENNQRFISNLQYKLRPHEDTLKVDKVSGAPAYDQPVSNFLKLRPHDYDRFDEHCDRTMVGFV